MYIRRRYGRPDVELRAITQIFYQPCPTTPLLLLDEISPDLRNDKGYSRVSIRPI